MPEAQTDYELAQLEYDSAKARLDTAKTWIEKQSILIRRDLEEQIAIAEQELLQLQTNFDRSRKLVQKGFVPENQLRNEEFQLGAAQRKLDSLKRQLDEFSTDASGNSANSQPDSNSGETTSDEDSEANQPTYKGETLRDVLSYAMTHIRNEISRQLVKTIQSDRESIELKLASIATSRIQSEPNLIDSLSGSFDPEELKPRELVTFLQLALQYHIGGARTLCLQLLAKNPDYLDEAFEPIDLDLWFVPTDVSRPDAMNTQPQKPMDQILEILDKIGDYLVLRSNESDESILALRKAATKTLQKRLKTTTGINKKKIERDRAID